MLNFRWCAN